jgi:ATP-dependent DNA ligase
MPCHTCYICYMPSHMERYGVRLFQAICQQDCEGIVGKYKRGAYTAAPTSWVKILNPNYSQKRDRQEMFENFRERGAAAGSPA